jgi:hypothetical protein
MATHVSHLKGLREAAGARPGSTHFAGQASRQAVPMEAVSLHGELVSWTGVSIPHWAGHTDSSEQGVPGLNAAT